MKKSLVASGIAFILQLLALTAFLLMLVPGLMKIYSGKTAGYEILNAVNPIWLSVISIIILALFAITLTINIKHIIAYAKGKVVSLDVVLVLLMYAILIFMFLIPGEMIKAFPLYNQIWLNHTITAFVYRFAVFGVGIYHLSIIFASFFAAMALSKKREKYAFDKSEKPQ